MSGTTPPGRKTATWSSPDRQMTPHDHRQTTTRPPSGHQTRSPDHHLVTRPGSGSWIPPTHLGVCWLVLAVGSLANPTTRACAELTRHARTLASLAVNSQQIAALVRVRSRTVSSSIGDVTLVFTRSRWDLDLCLDVASPYVQ